MNLFSFVPESPRWLIMRGNEWAGEVSLKWLRGRDPQNLDRCGELYKYQILAEVTPLRPA